MKNKKFPNGCGVLLLDDLDYEKIAADSLKKDLVDIGVSLTAKSGSQEL